MYYLMVKIKEFLKANLIQFKNIFGKLNAGFTWMKRTQAFASILLCHSDFNQSRTNTVFYIWILHINLFIFCSSNYFRNIKCTPARIEDEIQASNHSLDDGPNFALQQPYYFLQCTIREARHQILIMHSLFTRAVIPERQKRVSHMVDSNQMMYVLSSLEPYDG